ncbi:MAG: cobalamin biosynthesis protein [Clostridia bacterium]
MNVFLFAYSEKGCKLALKIAELFENSTLFSGEKFAKFHGVTPVKSTVLKAREVFDVSDLMVFVGACGIAVRSVAPCIKSKTSDPAVVVVDDMGNFVVSLLSGHIGMANDYCKFIANSINAVPVITTATDVNGKFSVDSFAVKNGLVISSMQKAMEFSAEILNENLPISYGKEVICQENLPNGLVKHKENHIGVYLGFENKNPYKNTLHLVPKVLSVGIGCKRDISKQAIQTLFDKVLNEYNLNENAVKGIFSIDLKKNEKALLDFCDEHNFNATFYTKEELLKAKGEFTSSNFVKTVTGVECVCERSAILGLNAGKILVKKTSLNGVTVAVAFEEINIKFD